MCVCVGGAGGGREGARGGGARGHFVTVTIIHTDTALEIYSISSSCYLNNTFLGLFRCELSELDGKSYSNVCLKAAAGGAANLFLP